MAATILWYLFTRVIKNPLLEENVLTAGRTENTKKAEKAEESLSDQQIPRSAFDGFILPYKENIEKIGQPFSLQVGNGNENEYVEYTMQCCINAVEFTKQGIDTDAIYSLENMGDDCPQMDEDYNILDEHSYIVINMTMRNTEAETVWFYTNSFWYDSIDPKTNDRFPMNGELRGYKTRKDLPEYNKSYARVDLVPGEEFTCNLVYIASDENIYEKVPYLRCNLSIDEDTRFVRLEE